jgi:hypothetical protein
MLISMANEIFRLYQDKDKEGNGCTLSLLVMIAYLFLGFFFVTTLGAGGAFLLIVMAMISWHYIRRRSRSVCLITTQEEGFILEVLKASAEIKVGKSFLRWKDLMAFRIYSARGGPYLELTFLNQETMDFTGYECLRFMAYLEKNFPEKKAS